MNEPTAVREGPWVRCTCGKIHVVLFATVCPACGADLNPLTRSCREEPKAAPVPLLPPVLPVTRTDMNHVLWSVCDPFPTYYRYGEGGKIVMRGDSDVPWKDEPWPPT